MLAEPVDLSEKKLCYLCDSNSMSISKNRRSIRFHYLHKYYKCHSCRGYSLFPKLKVGEIAELYSKKYIEDVNSDDAMKEEVTLNRFSDLIEVLQKLEDRQDRKFLDYGCGATAEVVIQASKLGYSSFGVEVEEGTRQEAQEKSNCQIYSTETLEECKSYFDIIFLGDVLEHLNEPLAVLKQLEARLAPSGILVLQGPLEGASTFCNTLISIKAILLARFASRFPPYHVSLATKTSIEKALNINGLVIQKLVITEPFWPAPKFGSRTSFSSVTKLIFSLAKILDVSLSKILRNYGTRFFLIATKG